MANTYTNALASLSDTNNTLVYTVPADTTAIINAIHVTNVLGSDATITVSLENTLTSFCLIKDGLVPADSALNVVDRPLVFTETEELKLQASDANAFDVLVSILEVS
jgi:hypothetical protein